jgi:integrative and conjugative element protein (TIGR02256 family)
MSAMADESTIGWLSLLARDAILEEAIRAGEVETGGVLLGYWGTKPVEPVICAVTGPGPRAKHSPTRFRPDYAFHQHEIARIYRESKRTIVYLGDWHSHPGGTGDLSARDVRTLARISRFRAARISTPIMLIAAGPPWDFALWLATRPLNCIWPNRSAIARLSLRLHPT